MTLKELQTELASMMDSLDVPRTWSQREVDTYETRRSNLRGRIHAVGLAMRAVAMKDPQVKGLAKWMNHLVEWRAILEKELTKIYDPRVTDLKTLGRIRALKLSIKRIDVGVDFRNELLPARIPLDDLMEKDGYMTRDDWHGSLPGLDRQLKTLMAERDDEEYRLKEALGTDKPTTRPPTQHTTERVMAKRHGNGKSKETPPTELHKRKH